MSKLTEMPRTRRRRAAVSVGLVLATVGVVFVVGTVRAQAVLHPVMLVGLAITGAGVAALVWGGRGHPAAAQAEATALAGEGRWDSLPPGAHEENGRIGLPSMTLWTKVLLPLAGVLVLAAGGAIVLASRGDREMLLGGCFVLALGVLMFVVLALSAGTVYWLDPDGISRARWPRRRVGWTEIESVTQDRQNIVLRTAGPTGPWWWRRKTFTISTGILEISQVQLTRLIEALREHASPAPTDHRRPGR